MLSHQNYRIIVSFGNRHKHNMSWMCKYTILEQPVTRASLTFRWYVCIKIIAIYIYILFAVILQLSISSTLWKVYRRQPYFCLVSCDETVINMLIVIAASLRSTDPASFAMKIVWMNSFPDRTNCYFFRHLKQASKKKDDPTWRSWSARPCESLWEVYRRR